MYIEWEGRREFRCFCKVVIFFGSFLETGFILFIIRGGLGEELDIVIRVVVDCF